RAPTSSRARARTRARAARRAPCAFARSATTAVALHRSRGTARSRAIAPQGIRSTVHSQLLHPRRVVLAARELLDLLERHAERMRIDADGEHDVRLGRRVDLDRGEEIEAPEDAARGRAVDAGFVAAVRRGDVEAVTVAQLRAEEVERVDRKQLRRARLLRAL